MIDRFSGLFAQFEPHGMSGFPLPDGGTIDVDAMQGHIFDLQADPLQTEETSMHNESLQKPKDPRQTPWNKGKLIGSKPPLRTKDVWSIRTKLQVEKRTHSTPHTQRRPPLGSILWRGPSTSVGSAWRPSGTGLGSGSRAWPGRAPSGTRTGKMPG
jgi:hypothetical protein